MKFFFPELGFCFGGTVISPSTEIIAADVSTTRRRLTQGNSTKQWRPELTAIAEDGGMLSVCRQPHQSPSVVRSEKKSLNKARSAGKTRSHSYGGDYRKLTHAMALPAFFTNTVCVLTLKIGGVSYFSFPSWCSCNEICE